MKKTAALDKAKIAGKMENVLSEEIVALKTAIEKAEKVREYIFDHDWKSLTEGIKEMDSSSALVNEIERRREKVFGELCTSVGVGKGAGFYSVVVRLHPKTRDRLSSLFRVLKTEVLQLQGITWSIDAYVRSMSETIKEVLYTAFPHRRGTMYEKSGRRRSVEADPLVVNRHL
ncbi:MAG: hypothetical protein ACLFNZ_08215 [Spirochaetaceae bacterium]